MSGTFLYLGASDYALRILREVLSRSESRPLCLIDVGMTDGRRQAIAREFSPRIAPDQIHDTAVLRDPAFLSHLRDDRPDFAFCAHFTELLSADFLHIPRHGVANLHSAYLPYNRGHWPEIWSIVRGTPAGITIHYIDAARGIDGGDIVDQARVAVMPEDTCETLAARIEVEGMELVVRHWDRLVGGSAQAKPQTQTLPINLHKHLDRISEIDLDRTYTGRELIDVLRALTIPRLLDGAFFIDPETGDRIRIQVSLKRQAQPRS